MDATQMIDDLILESDEEEQEDANKKGEPLAKLRVLKNEHIPETELPLYVGENVLGRDPNTCSLPLLARSVSKRHTVISISVFRGNGRRGEVAMEALVWDLGSMNGTRRSHFKLTPHVRYALGEGDILMVADIPCQYVSCAVDKMAGQRDIRCPLDRNSGRRGREDALKGKAQLNRTSRDQGLGCSTNADSEKHPNGNIITSAPSSSSDGEVTGKTPVRTKTLSFEQTPTQPQGTLVPESDSDSDGERGDRRDRWKKAIVSDSDSQMSSPTPARSTFLSPANKVIPESEDESPITPSSSSTENRPKKHVSFSEEERDVNVGRQQLKRRRAQVIVDDSDEEQQEGKKERAARGGGGGGGEESLENGKGEVSVEQANDVRPSLGDGLPVSTPAVTTDTLPALSMDSDTDVEGEEEVVAVAPAVPVTLNVPPADPPTDHGQLNMDSDTDVDESDDALDSGPKPVPASNDNSKPTDCIPAVHPTDLSLDSDTDDDDDDDDDDAAVSDTATKSRATSVESVDAADSRPSTQLKDFHLDSDTDVEEDKDDSWSKDANSNLDETHSRMDPNSSRMESTSAPQNLQLDSDTDDEGILVAAPVSSEPTGSATDAKSPTSADIGAHLEILLDSDTDLEEDGPLLPPAVAAATTAAPPSASMSATTVATAACPQSESDADTDVEEPLVPPAGVVADPQDSRMDSDTNVEQEEEAGLRKAVESQTPGLPGEKASGLLWGSVPSLQKCSTPVGLSGVEDMEACVFFSPSDPLRFPQPPALRPVVSSSDSQEDDDLIVAETQSFVLESRDRRGSCPVDPILDPTQAFCMEPSSGDDQEEESSRAGSFQLGLSDSSHPQARALALESTQAFVTFDGDLEATQAYGTAPPPDRASVEEDSELEATQAYGGNGKPARRSAVFEKEGQVDFALEATQAYVPEPHSDTEDEGEERANIATAETQDMSAYTGAEQEETQPFDLPTRYNVATAETQSMSALEEEDEDDLAGAKPPPPVRRGRIRRQKERDEDGEATQPQEVLTNQHLALAETQPVAPCDDEDSIPVLCKRRAKSQRLVEEETQPFTSSELSTAETQPMFTPDDDEDEVDRIVAKPPSHKRKVRSRRGKVEEEETQPFVTSVHIAMAETQPIATVEIGDEEEEEEETKAGPQKAKGRPQRGKGRVSEAGTSGISSRGRRVRGGGEGEKEEEEELSEPPKRLTRSKGKAASTARGRRGKGRPEEEVEQVQKGRGRKPSKRQIDEREEKERLQREQNEQEERLEREKKERTEEDRLQREEEEKAAKEREEKERMEQELEEREERERLEEERSEREERERMEGEKMELEERERLEKEKREEEERWERERKEKEEQERLEQERREKEEREENARLEREENERVERERKEQEEKERMERKNKEKEEQERLERENKEKEERERWEHEKAEREEKERLERERAEREMKERQEREENKRVERERKERDEKERMRKEKEEQERLEREKKEKEERERMEREKREQERERREKERREELERLERIRKEKEEQDRLERENKEKEEREEKERLEREEREIREREKEEKECLEKEAVEKQLKELQEKQDQAKSEENKPTTSARGRRAGRRTIAAPSTAEPDLNISTTEDVPARRTIAAPSTAEPDLNISTTEDVPGRRTIAAPSTAEPDLNISTTEDVPARRTIAAPSTAEPDLNISTTEDVPASRTRSRSNSSNSVCSERSSASVNTQGSRGRGRGSRRASQPAVENATRASIRQRTMAGEPPAEREDTGQDVVSSDVPAPGNLSRSSSFSSLNSEVSSSHVASQNRGRGGRGRGRGRKTGPEPVTDPVLPTSSQSDQPSSAPKATARGRKSRRVEDSTTDASQADGEDKAGSQQPSTTTRGRGRAKAKDSQPTVANEEVPTCQVEESLNEDSLLPKGGVKGGGRGRKAIRVETVETEVAAVGDAGDEAKERRRGKGRKREQEEEEEESSGAKIGRGTAKGQRGRGREAAEEEKVEQLEETPAPVSVNRGDRASTAQGKKNAKQEAGAAGEVKEESEKMEEGTVKRKARGRPSVAQKKKEEREDCTTASDSLDQNASVETSKAPQTPTGNAARKRAAPVDVSPVAKTPRASSASPGTTNRLRAANQAYKVLFTGVVDEAGEKVVCRLGGSMAKGVADMTYLVTDKVRRTVKFLCAVARGVPIVTTQWLDKCGKAGSFLSPNAFIVKDAEQEKKFDFCLQESLRTANNQPLLQGYAIHVTKSVKPEPVHMKDIITCSGASFLPKMPSVHKAQTVVVSCEEDWSLCGPAASASLPVVTAEFILTGILRQKIDLKTHALPAPASNTQSVGGRGRGRKKT